MGGSGLMCVCVCVKGARGPYSTEDKINTSSSGRGGTTCI